jgi:hypothetical protein
MHLALFEMPYSELAALVGLLSFLISGFIITPVVFWLRARFVSQKRHYEDKEEIWAGINRVEGRVDKLERESDLAKQPIMQMQSAVVEMKNELKALVDTIGKMDKSVSAGFAQIDKRVAVIEATKRRGSGGK